MAQKAIVPDALEAVGQDMQQETANEFVGFQCHGFLLVAMPIIFPVKSHLAILDVEQSVVGDGHAMGIAAQVVEDLFGTTERPFGIRHPLGFAKRRQILKESFPLPERRQRGEELELALVKGGLQIIEEQAAEQA